MSNNNVAGSLSKDEIDKLLQGTSDIELDVSDSMAMNVSHETHSSIEAESTVLSNLISKSLSYQTILFGTTYGRRLSYSSVKSAIKDGSQIINDLGGTRFLQMKVDYVEGIKGTNLIIVKAENVLRLSELVTGQMDMDLNESVISSFTELMMLLMKEAAKYFSRRFGKAISLSEPQIEIADSPSRLRIATGSQVVHISYDLNPEGESLLKIHNIIDVQLAKELINLSQKKPDLHSDSSIKDMGEKERKKPNITIRPVQYSTLEKIPNVIGQGNISLLLDIDMEVSVELGRTRKQIKELLSLSAGGIIELDKQAGEPVDILVNDRIIAKGEVMVMDEMFGVRITQILNANDRLEMLL